MRYDSVKEPSAAGRTPLSRDPPLAVTRLLWQGMMQRLYRAVRDESPDMTVILTGGRGGILEGLVELDPRPDAADPNVRYSFH